jgi:hypothetical protein
VDEQHHYAFTDRMQTVFVAGSVLLVVLVFALGLVIGHLWWPSEGKSERDLEARALHAKPAGPVADRRDPGSDRVAEQDALPPAANAASGHVRSATADEPSAYATAAPQGTGESAPAATEADK